MEKAQGLILLVCIITGRESVKKMGLDSSSKYLETGPHKKRKILLYFKKWLEMNCWE